MNFVTLVVETAKGHERNTIYAICLVKYLSGKKVDTLYSLVKPPELCVQPNMALLHDSLSSNDLINAPTIAELWNNKIESFIGDLPISSHRDGSLDNLFINLEWFGVKVPILHCFNTYLLVTNTWSSLKRRHLPEIALGLNIPYEDNNIIDDADFYGRMILFAAETRHCSTLEELLEATDGKLSQKIIGSRNLWHNKTEITFENYSIQELEQFSLELYNNYYSADNKKEVIAEIINDILEERGRRLDNAIIWTEENVNKLLKANKILDSAAEKAHFYAQSIIEKLDLKRINNEENIKKDIYIKLHPSINGLEIFKPDECSEYDRFSIVLDYPVHNKYLLEYHSDNTIYFDKSDTWLEGLWDKNLEVLDCFKDKYISYCVHELWESGHWSFHDIMNIDSVRIELEIDTEIGCVKYTEEDFT